MDIQERLVRFYQILLDGDTGAFLTMFAGDPLIDTPHLPAAERELRPATQTAECELNGWRGLDPRQPFFCP